MDVQVGSKYTCAYIQVSPIEIICILNIFAVKYVFSDKRMKLVAVIESKEISKVYILY